MCRMAVRSRPESPSKTSSQNEADVEMNGSAPSSTTTSHNNNKPRCICLHKLSRRKIDEFLDSVWVQMAVVIIVFVQMPLLGSLLMIDYSVIRGPPELPPPRPNDSVAIHNDPDPGGGGSGSALSVGLEDPPVVLAERILHTINIVILLLFLVEIILRVSARGSRIHTDGLQVFDGAVVMLTFVLYVGFTAANIRSAAYGCGLIIILRLWRIRRIVNTIAAEERRKLEKTLATQRKAQKDTEEQLKHTTAKLTAMTHEMDVLQQQLKVIHYIGKASPAISSSAYSKVSEDLVTSDEESERYMDCDSQIQMPKTIETIQAEITAAGLGGRHFYSHSLTTSNTPSPATSFSHLVDEFLLHSEFKDFKDLSALSKAAPTKISVPDLVEHLQDADGKVKGHLNDPTEVKEDTDLTKTDSGVLQYHNKHNSLQHTDLQHSLDLQGQHNTDLRQGHHQPPRYQRSLSESQVEVAHVHTEMETGSPLVLRRPQRLSDEELIGNNNNESSTDSPTHRMVALPTVSAGIEANMVPHSDKQQLISKGVDMRETGSERGDGGHDNLAFTVDEMTAQAQGEPRQGAELPPLRNQYGSSTYLNEEGIPMTDL